MGHLWLLLLFACASPAAVLGAIDERCVAQAASADMSTSDIALQLGRTQRRIHQILAFLSPPSAAQVPLRAAADAGSRDALLEI